MAVTFTNRIYWGDSIIPDPIDEVFIKSLQNNLQTTNATQVASNTVDPVYFWFASPVAYGEPSFVEAEFLFGIPKEEPIHFTEANGNQFTNELGHLEDYYLYRATNAAGDINIIVT